jgi:uncharacterized UBP type Zn finger protein
MENDQFIVQEDALSKYNTSELIEFNCECGEVQIEKSRRIESLAPLLTMQLFRVYFDNKEKKQKKLNSRMTFPDFIDMKKALEEKKISDETRNEDDGKNNKI